MGATDANRRQGDRRRTGRRGGDGGSTRTGTGTGTGGRRHDDTLFPDFGPTDSSAGAESYFDAGWLASGEAATDSRFLLRQARRIVHAQDDALARVYRTYAAARAVIGLGLVGVQGASSLLGTRPAEWLTLISLLYGVQAVTLCWCCRC